MYSSPIMQEIFEYWSSKSQNDELPARSDIDPIEIKSVLPVITLVDVVRSDNKIRFRSRLIGTEIARRFGRDITGKFADELYGEEYLDQLNQIYNKIVDDKKPTVQECVSNIDGKTFTYKRIILPLASDGMNVDMLLTAFAFDDNPYDWEGRVRPGISKWQETFKSE